MLYDNDRNYQTANSWGDNAKRNFSNRACAAAKCKTAYDIAIFIGEGFARAWYLREFMSRARRRPRICFGFDKLTRHKTINIKYHKYYLYVKRFFALIEALLKLAIPKKFGIANFGYFNIYLKNNSWIFLRERDTRKGEAKKARKYAKIAV